jgi:DNA primase large subunit
VNPVEWLKNRIKLLVVKQIHELTAKIRKGESVLQTICDIKKNIKFATNCSSGTEPSDKHKNIIIERIGCCYSKVVQSETVGRSVCLWLASLLSATMTTETNILTSPPVLTINH